MSNNDFKELLEQHLKLVHSGLNVINTELVTRIYKHDQDKIFNPVIYDIYNKYFPRLKTIPFGTKEYVEFEREYFTIAHSLHAQNRHHFYSKKNTQTDTNLIDVIEAIIDINASSKQYNENYSLEQTMNSIKLKEITQYDLESLIYNTLKFVNEKQ